MKRISILFKILFFLYLAYLFYLVFLSKYYGRTVFHRDYNLIPFGTIRRFLLYSRSPRAVATNIAGNILAFVPMGFLAPASFKRMRSFVKVFLLALVFTCGIEIAQYIAGVGAFDIDDVILNLLGGGLGYLVFRVFKNNEIWQYYCGGGP